MGRARTMALAILRESLSSAFRKRRSANSFSGHSFTISAAVSGSSGFMRISSGAAQRKENPRSGLSSSRLDTPRSARTPSSGGSFNSVATSPIFENSACTRITRRSCGPNRSRAISRACGSRSIPTNRPVVSRRAISIAWPPVPTVASRYVPSGRIRSQFTTSSSRTGVCRTLKS